MPSHPLPEIPSGKEALPKIDSGKEATDSHISRDTPMEYVVHELLGTGGFGTVHRATLTSGDVVAVKVIDIAAAAARDSRYTVEYLTREVDVHRRSSNRRWRRP